MKAGYYKLIDREGYLSSHKLNEEVLKVYGDTLHVDVKGNSVLNKQGITTNLLSSSVLLTRNELEFFEYLGETLPKPVTKPIPVYRRNKRTPKAGEVWTMFNAYGEQVFFYIHRILGHEGARKVQFSIDGSRRKYNLGMSKFCRQPASRFKGINQYRVFSH